MGLSWGYGYVTNYYTIVDLLPLEGYTNSRLFSLPLGTQLNQEGIWPDLRSSVLRG
jgi:hypothetical protein